MGSRKLQIWLPLLFAMVMIAGMIIGFQLKEKTMASRFLTVSSRSSIQELTELIKNKYVDKVSEDSINALVATQLLEHLDPHSVFIPAKELSAVNEEMMGNFQGIGIEFRMIDDTVNVMSVMKNGPAEKAGLLPGDRLLAVSDTIAVSGKKMDADRIRSLFRGELNSQVKVKYLRNKKIQSVTITRNIIPVNSIDAAYLVEPGKGYIRINKFAERTYEEFMQNLEKLQAQKMQSLIVDLRGNGGGLMKEAVDIADEFLDDNKLIVYTEGEHAPRMEYRCKRPGLFEKGKLVVLIDETSASASEVLAGALQDWDRATIIGRRSFGKGLVQQQFQLSDGAAVRLTVARYFTPLGRNIQKSYNKGVKAYQDELINRFHQNDSSAKKEPGDSTRKIFKTQSGKIVYGGGGITPDTAIAFDSTRFSNQFIQLLMTGSLNNFAYRYFVQNNALFGQFKSPESFSAGYVPGNAEWVALTAYAQKDQIDLSPVNAKGKEIILNRFKALIARHLWRDQGYFMISNQHDPVIGKALQILK
ncbi:MAG TPA: S41 family peptidase [Sediminibacterium sp.]|nr:S41 family peptidase [Sediminibacterium sp.]